MDTVGAGLKVPVPDKQLGLAPQLDQDGLELTGPGEGVHGELGAGLLTALHACDLRQSTNERRGDQESQSEASLVTQHRVSYSPFSVAATRCVTFL